MTKRGEDGRYLEDAGMYLTEKGYWRYSAGEHRGKYVHRVMMEKHLGRKLRKDEIIHHGNGEKLDVRIENLIVLNEIQHNAVSARQYWYLTTYVWGKEDQAWREYFDNPPPSEFPASADTLPV